MAFVGVDFRDLYRRGSGLTLRRLLVLLQALPPDAPLWAALHAAEEDAKKPKADEIRSAQDRWKARNEARRAREEAS